MKDILGGHAIDFLWKTMEKIFEEVKTDFKWRTLFVTTGEFLTDNTDTLKSFENDLRAVFSEENLKELSKRSKDKKGYDFQKFLHDEMFDLMICYEVAPVEAETYIHYFSQVIMDYIEKNDSEKSLEIFLGEWRREEQGYFDKCMSKSDLILKCLADLNQIEVSSLTIADIDAKIRKESVYKKMSLDFYELDDEQFEMKFHEMLDSERIFVVGKSREEAIYRILNELKKKETDKITLVIQSQKEWNRLERSNISGKILIPFFYADSICTISNNTNIFVYGEDEPCYNRDKLELRRRTKKSIIQSLKQIGMDSSEAYNIVENTHGLYAPMKKKLFNGAVYNKPEWIEKRTDVVMTAFLCGKWSEVEGDKLIFEVLSGHKYSECKKELEKYSHGENPFVIEMQGYKGSNMQLASVEDAWEELDVYISNETWDKFTELVFDVVTESEPIFNHPLEKHFEASLYTDKPEWSQALKHGMIRTLIMRACYRKHDENQRHIDKIVERVLATITSKERWAYISQYITDLCEASPSAVMEKLEQEFVAPTGLRELFAVKDGDFMTSRHYYTHILWAIEHLLQQKMYVARAIEWLWKMDSCDIKYNISNSPKSVLDVVFSAWINESVLSVDNKISLAKKAIQTYPNAWDIISSKLPSGSGGMCTAFSTPKYRSIDEPDELYVHEVNTTYIEYLRMCVNAINGDAKRWHKIIEHLHWYEEKIQDEILQVLMMQCNQMNDSNKIKVKNEIRHLIYRHRYFANADWSMSAEQTEKYENTLNQILLDDPIYDFVYLFSPLYEFPLLHPISFDKENRSGESREKNHELREEELKLQFKIFRENRYSIEKLIELTVDDERFIVGDVLAKFYSCDKFDEKLFLFLIEKDKEGKHVFDYVRSFVENGSADLKHVVEKVKQLTDNKMLTVRLIALESIKDVEKALIAGEEEEIKKAYWSRMSRFVISNQAKQEVYIWALEECCKYGTLDSYLELLFDLKEKLSNEQIYQYIFAILELKSQNPNTMTDYYLEELLKIIQNEFYSDSHKCEKIATLEWACRNVLEWEQMKCIQSVMKSDPTIYAWLVQVLYKSEDRDEADEEKRELANKLYSGFEKAKFCPAETDGKVQYQHIKSWVEKFNDLLVRQKQGGLFGHLLGKLLAFSPVGEDGYMPCEAVRQIIEEYYSKDLVTSYVIAEQNKRGVYTADAGKSEMKLHQKYKANAQGVQEKYPRTAEIFSMLSTSYKRQADMERRQAEDEW